MGDFYHFKTYNVFKDFLDSKKIQQDDICFIKDKGMIYTHGKYYSDLSSYLKTADADKKYIQQGSSTSSSITVDDKGAMSNFSDNGQAFLAVRSKTTSFLITQPYAGAAFGVKMDGTAAFSHKTYTTYNSSTGKYSGARNTAVLQFAGDVGLRYGKNTSTGSDVTEDMYRYVGVIDSQDEFQRVYSAKQVDDIINPLIERIEELEKKLNDLNPENTNE